MLTYDLNKRNGLPLYDDLYRRIREDILHGVLTAGERLPSKRRLAEHLGVSVITVEGAYQQLEAEGYLYTRPRSGFFVSRVERLASPPPPEAVPSAPEPPIWKLDLKTNQVDAARFPFAVWSRLTRRVLAQEGGQLLRPISHQGLPALRQAIAEDLRNYRGMAVSPEQIVIGAGSEYLYLLLAQLLGRDAVFAVEDPGYPRIAQVYRRSGVRCVPVPLDAQGLRVDALERSGASVAHISPSHHYPTGLVTPIRRRQELLEWADRTDGVMIEDDYDSELRFAGRPIPPLQSIDRAGRVIYMNTFSQTIAPSMRIGFLALPPRLLERWLRELDFYTCPVASTEQSVLAHFIAEGQYEKHLSRMRKEYRDLRSAVLTAFRTSSFASRIVISEQGAGLHFLMRLSTERTDAELIRRAAAYGVRLGFLSEYTAAPNAACGHTLVVNYAGLTAERLPETMELLSAIFSE
jgi:GntR family transcriptional regulator/MocR family aminotransferase